MMEYVVGADARARALPRQRLRAERRASPRRPAASDAFYIKIDKHYGSSDHVTYMQHGIPAVMFITWPDMWYHSSEDTPDKQDPTQYKRAAVVGTGALAVIATGGDDDGRTRHHREPRTRNASGWATPSGRRVNYLADATTPDALHGGVEGRAGHDPPSGGSGEGA